MKKYELGLYEKSMPNCLTIEEKIKYGKSSGFDFMELSIDESDEKLSRLGISKEERLNLVKAMYENDFSIGSICLSGHRKYPLGSLNQDIRRKSMEIMKGAIDLASDLGVRIIQIAGYDVYYEESTDKTKELFKENLKLSVQYAAKKGVILAFETMETDFMNTVEKAMEYVEEINSPYLKIYPDSGNVTNAVKDLDKTLRDDFYTGEGNIAAVHLKETVPGKFREIPFGTGHVNFQDVIKTSLDLGVRRFVLEFWAVDGLDWKEEIKKSKEFMDREFKAVEKSLQ